MALTSTASTLMGLRAMKVWVCTLLLKIRVFLHVVGGCHIRSFSNGMLKFLSCC